jgi:hypothetical protein
MSNALKNRLILVIAFFISASVLYSQKHPQFQTIGIKAGGGLYGIMDGVYYDKYDKFKGWTISPVLNYSVSDYLVFSGELGYEQKGAPDSRFNYNTILDYLILPVHAKFLFNKSPRFYGMAGIYAGYLLKATEKGEKRIGAVVSPVFEDVTARMNRFDAGLSVGAGYMIRLNLKVDFVLELKAHVGLLTNENIEGFSPRNYGYTLSAGYLYYIGFR